MAGTGRIQSLERAIMILKCFSEEDKELKLTDISERLGLNKSTVHGIITTLKYYGIIEQNEENQKYKLGLYLMELGNLVQNSIDVTSIAAPIINRVCLELEETVHLGKLENTDIVYIEKKESTQSMRIFTSIGARNPAYCTAVGKAMLAFKDKSELMQRIPEVLEKFNPNTISDKEVLLEELETIRKTGIAIDNEEKILGLTCVAAPVFDSNGNANYGISVSGPTIRMDKEKIDKAKKIVSEAAKEISLKLGYKE